MGRLAAGKFEHRVMFEQPSPARNALGVVAQGTWVVVEPAMANVRFGSGSERREAAAQAATNVATFRVRSTAAIRGVTEDCRIMLNGQPWYITGIAPVEAGAKEIEFTATVRKG